MNATTRDLVHVMATEELAAVLQKQDTDVTPLHAAILEKAKATEVNGCQQLHVSYKRMRAAPKHHPKMSAILDKDKVERVLQQK